MYACTECGYPVNNIAGNLCSNCEDIMTNYDESDMQESYEVGYKDGLAESEYSEKWVKVLEDNNKNLQAETISTKAEIQNLKSQIRGLEQAAYKRGQTVEALRRQRDEAIEILVDLLDICERVGLEEAEFYAAHTFLIKYDGEGLV